MDDRQRKNHQDGPSDRNEGEGNNESEARRVHWKLLGWSRVGVAATKQHPSHPEIARKYLIRGQARQIGTCVNTYVC